MQYYWGISEANNVTPEWTARCRINGYDRYYQIGDRIRAQALIQDKLEYLLHGRIVYRDSTLNPNATIFNLADQIHEHKPYKSDSIKIDQDYKNKPLKYIFPVMIL